MNQRESKMGLKLHPLKTLIEQSYLNKSRSEIDAILSPIPTSNSSFHLLGETYRVKNEVEILKFKCSEQNKVIQIRDSQSTSEYTETLPTLPTGKSSGYYFQNWIKYNLLRQYRVNSGLFNLENINKIIYNDNSHLVAQFKDFLIYEDVKELLQMYNGTRSKCKLVELVKKTPKNLVLFTYLINQTNAVKQAIKKRNKIRKIKAEDREHQGEQSTLFKTGFMNSLAKEDLSNSISVLPTISLECSQNEDMRKIEIHLVGELLGELNNDDKSSSDEEREEYDKQIPLNKKIAEGIIDRKNIMTAEYRNPKIFSSNACYEKSPKINTGALVVKSLDKFLFKGSSRLRNRTLARLLTDAMNGVKTYNIEAMGHEHRKNNCFNIYAKKFKFKPANVRNTFGSGDNISLFTSPLNKETKFNMFSKEKEKNRIVLSMSTRFRERSKITFRKEGNTGISPKTARLLPRALPKKRIVISPKVKSN